VNRYPESVTEAIWTLHKAGNGIADIHRALNSGQVDGIELARPIPYETVRAKVRRLRLTRAEDLSKPLHTSDDQEPIDVIADQFLRLARDKAEQIRQATTSRTIKPDEAQALERLARTVAALRVKPASQSDSTKARAGAQGGKGRAATSRSLLGQLAAAEREAVKPASHPST
jgi:hypothetical protein